MTHVVAIATPAGRGGIGVVRISGPDAPRIAEVLLDREGALEPRRATFTRLVDREIADDNADGRRGGPSGPPVSDEVVATFFPAPHSYTGQHVVEISAHGSPVVLEGVVRAAVDAGARLAQPGEFTLRAFLNGKRDLVQAEAVADLIAAATPLQARVAFDQLEGTLTRRIAAIDAELFDLIARLEASLDFPDEGYHFVQPSEVAEGVGRVVARIDTLLGEARRGRMIREGATVVIAGRTNVGKSSLFNMLAGTDRAIVTEIPGTTRDLVTERIDIGGLAVTIVDTAGARDTLDVVEREGVNRGSRATEVADLVLVVLDASEPLTGDDERLLGKTDRMRRLVVANKCDQETALVRSLEAAATKPKIDLQVSATTGEGIIELRDAIAAALTGTDHLRDTAAISNARHIALLERARADLVRARDAAGGEGAPEEFVLTDLQSARSRFDEIVGARTSEDVLAHIFERFCIGK
jgi:tRNA modification GTPase